jgi:uncharacterized protein with HEPN domain
MRDAKLYFADILRSCDRILSFTTGHTVEQYRADEKTESAVERQFEIIGEAARQLPREYQDRHPHIPWRKIKGMRNIIAHGYFGIDDESVWDAILNDIGRLKADIEAVLASWESVG